jgi:ferritin-like metal-binding protein YciE
MSLETMEDLLVHQLRDIYNAEKQILKALPKLAKQVTNETLEQALLDHVEETQGQVARLEECFELLEVSSRGKKCKAMEGLLAEGSEFAEEAEDDDIRDAGLIGECQKVEHYEISAYGTARALAEKLGLDEVVELLTATLEEESAANEKLTEIAESEVNYEALEDGDEEEEEEAAPAAKRGASGGAKRGTAGSRR